MGTYSTALTGLQANTTALNVVGDNLANMNTQGFKSNSTLFEAAMTEASASLQVGGGVLSTSTSRNFTQGSIQTTNQPLNAAIQGSGFFVVQNPNGSTQYTRDGSFSLNSTGQLVDSAGDLVQGWSAVNGVVTASGAVSNITVPPLTSEAPTATANMSLSGNLNAATVTGGTFATPIQVVDSLGSTHTLTVTFTQTAANSWGYAVTIPGADVKGGTPGSPPTSVATGTVTFSSSGALTAPAATDKPVVVKTTGGLADGAADLGINFSLYDSTGNPTLTQFAQASTSSGTTQDGVQPGSLNGVSLQTGGALVATYSNGKTATIAQVAVASISNPDTLIGVANNNYTVGVTTATPSVGAAGTADRGNILGGSLESSNVDMATEFTHLIVFQRGYEANSKVLTTAEQMDQALLAINP